jgi:hypothetical protein
MGLLECVPIFPGFFGFYAAFRSADLNAYLNSFYDKPRMQNRNFYKMIKKVRDNWGEEILCKLVILMINPDAIYRSAQRRLTRLFSGIAIEPDAIELSSGSRSELLASLEGSLVQNPRYSDIHRDCYCELHVIHELGKEITFDPRDIQAIIVDSNEVVSKVHKYMGKEFTTLVSKFPRSDMDDFYETAVW